MLRIALLATLLLSTPVLCAKERILLHRIGPSESTLFIANADGTDERPLLPNSGFDYNASFSGDGKWIVFTSERNGSADIYRVHAMNPGDFSVPASSNFGAHRRTYGTNERDPALSIHTVSMVASGRSDDSA